MLQYVFNVICLVNFIDYGKDHLDFLKIYQTNNLNKLTNATKKKVYINMEEYLKKIQEENPEIDIEEFKTALESISFIESSGGKNMKHKRIRDPESMHYGHRAGGRYGIMPLTVAEFLKKINIDNPKIKELKDKFIYEGGVPRIKEGVNPDEISDMLEKNKDIDDILAITGFSNILKKNNEFDYDKTAYRWKFGQNKKPDEEDLNKSDYVRKFRRIKDLFKKE